MLKIFAIYLYRKKNKILLLLLSSDDRFLKTMKRSSKNEK